VARIDVIMPQMGESIAEGTVSKWLKAVGDEVKRDEPIFEISTDKVDAEIPSPAAGRLAEILITEGQTVAVQTVVARLETDVSAPVGVASSPAGVGAGGGVNAGLEKKAPARAGAAGGAGATGTEGKGPGTASAGVAGNGGKAYAGNGNSFEDRVRTKSSPLVRRIAAEHGIELTSVSGSGIAGRVTRRDIEGLLAKKPARPAGAPSMHAPGGVEVHAGPVPEAWEGDVVEPMSKMRALISDHMVVSRRTSAHVTSVFETDLTRIARIRSKRRAEFEAAGARLSYLPFVIKSVVDGLKKFPALNASVAGTNIIYRKQYNIGIAVALDWGLIVPVIKRADELSLVGLAKTLVDLANRARAKKLKPEEVEGGTFTITNPGVFGSLLGTPIINQPQVAIMGVGAIEKRPKVITGADGEETIAIRTCAYFSISFDHRLIDGAVADEFMAYVKKQMETFPDAAV
jgi:pyruvate dehydrogenase E2 component (dihydrolipoamide acetyltransferase)